MAASNGKASSGDQERLVKATFDNAAAEIKEDVPQLAAVWAEAGLILWHHCYRGEDGQAEVVNAGVATTCLVILDSQEASSAEKSTAAGILLTLCEADAKHRELICKAKVGASSACHVLHDCVADPQAVPRHVVALLAFLASDSASLLHMLKVLQSGVPWGRYRNLVDASHKDHATAIAVAKLLQTMVTGRQSLAEEAVAAGLLQALLLSITKHKSAAAVGALASCLQALCEADPANRLKLGQLPGAVQALVDLLGPPPATVVAWEQQQFKHINNPNPAQQIQQPQQGPGAATVTVQSGEHVPSYQQVQDSKRLSSIGVNVSRSLSKARGSLAASKGGLALTTPRRVGADGEVQLAPTGQSKRVNGSIKLARSIRLPDEAGSNGLVVQDPALANKRQQVSIIGAEQSNGARLGRAVKDPTTRRTSQNSSSGASQPECAKADLPQPMRPLLCKNVTSLKWDGPVPDATRSAVAGVLAELVMSPELCAAVNDRLAVPRLTGLLLKVMAAEAASGKGKSSKRGGKLSLVPESELLLTHTCACMKFLVAADNANCYRVATAGCLPALVSLAAESKKLRLRQNAQAVLSQICTLSEVQDLVKQDEVPEELWVQVPLKLTDSELRQLMIEYPSNNSLQPLDDVTARART